MSGAIRSVPLTKDDKGTPAVDIDKVRATNPDLANLSAKAGIALAKRGLGGIRAQSEWLVDHSGSMYGDFASGAVQILLARCLAFSLQFDTNGQIPVIPFDTKVWDEVTVDASNFVTVVQSDIWRPNEMGTTNLAAALENIKRKAEVTDEPMFVGVLTDGNPDSQAEATQIVCELANYPVFLKFMALRPVTYLSVLDNLEQTHPGARLLDNVDTKPSSDDPIDLLACSDALFMGALADEWDTWVAAALAAGVLKA